MELPEQSQEQDVFNGSRVVQGLMVVVFLEGSLLLTEQANAVHVLEFYYSSYPKSMT